MVALRHSLTFLCRYAACLLLCLLYIADANAQQQPVPDWVKQIGGTGESKVTGIAVDQANNVYVAGDFREQLTVDFSGAPSPIVLTSKGDYDIFVAKYTPDGRLLWAKGFGGDGWDQVNNLAVDPGGNVVMSCFFQSTAVDCDPGSGLANFVNLGAADAVVVKFNTDGSYAWARSVSGGGPDFGHQVYADNLGNVIFTGAFSGSVDLPNKTLVSKGDLDAFIVKYDSSGNVLWAYNMGGFNRDEFTSLKTNSNQEIFITGFFIDDVDLNPAVPGTTVQNAGKNYFLCKYSPSGQLIWQNKVEGGGDPAIASLAVNGSSVYLTGMYSNQYKFNAQTGPALSLNYPGRNLFITKYNDAGNPVWASNIGTGSDASFNYCITADTDDNVYISGFFEGGLTFGSGANTKSLSNQQGRDTFCAKFDGTGAFVWAFNLNSTCSSNYAHKVAVDSEKHVILGGMFCGRVDFNPSGCTLDLTAKHFVGDGYLARYNQVIPGVDEPKLLTAALPQQNAPAVINAAARTVTFSVPPGTDLSRLRPKLTTDMGILNPLSEAEVDLSNPKRYLISSNCVDYEWKLIVSAQGHTVTQANAGPDVSLCNTNIITLAANNPATTETGAWSVVSPANFQPFNAGNISNPKAVINNLPDDQEVILKWTISYAADQTESSATVRLFNYKKPVLTLQQTATINEGQSLQIPASLNGNPNLTYTYLWSPASHISSTSVLAPTVNPDRTTVYHLSINYGTSCSVEQDFTVVVKKTTAMETCAESSVLLAGDATSNGQPGYTWQVLDGGVWTDMNGAFQKDLRITAENDGSIPKTWEYRRHVISDLDSYYDSFYTLEVLPKIVNNTISFTGPTVFCDGRAEQLAISGSTAANPNSIYSWEKSTDGNSWENIGGSGKDLNISVLLETTYFRRTIKLGTCSSISNNIQFTINQPVTLADAGQDAVLCASSSLQLHANAAGLNETGTWSVTAPAGYSPFSAQNIHDPNATITNLPQNQEIELTWTIDNPNCNSSNSASIRIFSHQDIRLQAAALHTIQYGEQINLAATASLAAGQDYTIDWSPKKGLSSYNTLNPIASPAENTTYTLTVSYGDKCVQTIVVTIVVLKSVELPNTFSPNNDGINDTWVIKGLGNYPGSSLSVFNRYGILLYRSTPQSASWDGTYRGKQMPAGAYFYVAVINDENRSVYKGIITILR